MPTTPARNRVAHARPVLQGLRRRAETLVTGLLGLVLGACASLGTGSDRPEPPPGEIRLVKVIVRSDSSAGERVVAELKDAGYQSVELSRSPSGLLELQYGGASSVLLDHLAIVTGDAVGLPGSEFRREQTGDPTDPFVYVHVGASAICAKKPDCAELPEPATHLFHGLVEVEIFSDSSEGLAVGKALRERGFLLVELGETSPNEDLNIKYGAAPPSVIDEVAEVAAQAVGVEPSDFKQLRIFEADDDDIFINVGRSAIATAKSDRGATLAAFSPVQEVVLFSDDQQVSSRVKTRLEEEGVRVIQTSDGPNDEINVKLGAEVSLLAGRFQTLLADELGVRLDEVLVYQDAKVSTHSVFINLPVKRIPEQCGFSEKDVQFGRFEVGSTVTLRRHRVIRGSDNWTEEMDTYIGRSARVIALDGIDEVGCAVVKVDVDNGEYYWRIRDMVLVEGDQAI